MAQGDGDKRKVSTDALETLGTILGENEKRDAIHLAVEPVIAGAVLVPGQHITVNDGVAYPADVGRGLGIVDPFIHARFVEAGQRFWFVMYPRMVHSLRHVWTHPAFADESAPPLPQKGRSKEASEAWLRDFISRSDCPDYETVIAAAVNNDDEYLHFTGSDAHGDIPAEFWDHVETVTGRKIPDSNRASYFSCSC